MTSRESSAQTIAAAPVAAQQVRVTPEWLALREPADAAARSLGLVDLLRSHLRSADRTVVHDLGCGTGSMARWLAPKLPGRQHWIMYDRDADLLDHAYADRPVAADGSSVTVETRQRDITKLDSGDLSGASLITASALLDMFTDDELDRFVRSCVDANCPALLTISVVGRVELAPADGLDSVIADAFNAHQSRLVGPDEGGAANRHSRSAQNQPGDEGVGLLSALLVGPDEGGAANRLLVGGRRLLGPDAVDAAVAAFTRLGAEVLVRPSPWLLGREQAELAAEWFAGWLDAAGQQRPELVAATADYARRRMAQAMAGELGVTVHHLDLLAIPG